MTCNNDEDVVGNVANNSVDNYLVLTENVDTDLCRLIASKAMQRNQFDHLTKKTKSIREDSTSTVELLSTDSVYVTFLSNRKHFYLI